MVRVLRLGSTERTLLKGFTGAVTDLAFAHLDSTLLGCVDEAGNMFIWQLTSQNTKIQYLPLGTVFNYDELQRRINKMDAAEETCWPLVPYHRRHSSQACSSWPTNDSQCMAVMALYEK